MIQENQVAVLVKSKIHYTGKAVPSDHLLLIWRVINESKKGKYVVSNNRRIYVREVPQGIWGPNGKIKFVGTEKYAEMCFWIEDSVDEEYLAMVRAEKKSHSSSSVGSCAFEYIGGMPVEQLPLTDEQMLELHTIQNAIEEAVAIERSSTRSSSWESNPLIAGWSRLSFTLRMKRELIGADLAEVMDFCERYNIKVNPAENQQEVTVETSPSVEVEVIKTKRRGHHVMFDVKVNIPSIRNYPDEKKSKYTLGEVDGNWNGESIELNPFVPRPWHTVKITTRQYLDIMISVMESDALKRATESIIKAERVYWPETKNLKPCPHGVCDGSGIIKSEDGSSGTVCLCKLDSKEFGRVYAIEWEGRWYYGNENSIPESVRNQAKKVVAFEGYYEMLSFMDELGERATVFGVTES